MAEVKTSARWALIHAHISGCLTARMPRISPRIIQTLWATIGRNALFARRPHDHIFAFPAHVFFVFLSPIAVGA